MKRTTQWVDSKWNPITVGSEMIAHDVFEYKVIRVERGEIIGDVHELVFQDPNHFRAGEVHSHLTFWEMISEWCPSATQTDVLGWVRDMVSIFPYFQHFTGSFKGEHYDSDRQPKRIFRNNMSCKPFCQFCPKNAD